MNAKPKPSLLKRFLVFAAITIPLTAIFLGIAHLLGASQSDENWLVWLGVGVFGANTCDAIEKLIWGPRI